MERSEIKRQYKEAPPAAGIFVIRNERNGKVLVGRSRNVEGILNRHRFDLRMKSHRNRDLQREWDEAGADAFTFEAVETLDPTEEKRHDRDLDEELKVLEALWLEKLRPWDERGYHPRPRPD